MTTHDKLLLQTNILSHIPDSIIITDLQGTITYWNRGATQVYGYTREEMLGQTVGKLYPDKSETNYKKDLRKVLQDGEFMGEWSGKKKNGQIICVKTKTAVLKDKKGNAIGFIGISHDITDRKEKERRLKESQNNLLFLSKASELLASSLDYNHTVNSVVKLVVSTLADWCAVDVLQDDGEVQLVAIGHKDPKKVRWAKQLRKENPIDMTAKNGIPHVLRTGKSEIYPVVTEDMIVANAKSEKEAQLARELGISSVMYVPLKVHKRVIGVIELVNTESGRHFTPDDVTLAEELANKASLEIENAHLYAEAQKAIALRDDFISVASHELKTPLTSLKMYIQGMMRHFIKEGDIMAPRYLGKMDNQINKLTLLVGDMLNISRLQIGRLEFSMEAFDLKEVVQEVVESIQPTTDKHTIQIKGLVDRKVWGDKDRIGQVVTNLLTNAIKYSPEAEKVVVHVSSDKEDAVVTVQDFGIGIEKKHLRRIFERFYRVSSPEEKTFPGLGIGLYLSNEIVQRHGGKMRVESIKKKGSKFSFTIPHVRSLASNIHTSE